mmetsp:Transcript_19037/g.61082  ORF Transcript_19037/g.61082 Transcript_19037/m.61082 type:complete len:123 (+) Transcript_19037:236-604(+)
MWLEDVAYGALTGGVNASTLVVLNVVLVATLSVCVWLVFIALHAYDAPIAIPLTLPLVFIAVGLIGGVNWFVASTGTVDPATQRKELFGAEEAAEGGGEGGANKAPVPAAEKDGGGAQKKDA